MPLAERLDPGTVLSRLRAHQAELMAMGVRRLALFGCHARGEAGEASDIDLGVVFDDAARNDTFAYFGHRQRVADRLAAILGTEVDLSDESMQRPDVRDAYAAERVYAF